VPCGRDGSHDALLVGGGTVHRPALRRSELACHLRAEAAVPFGCSHAALFPLHSTAGHGCEPDAPGLALSSGTAARTQLFQTAQSSSNLEPVDVPGFAADEHSLCVAQLHGGRLAQVTARAVTVVDTTGGRGILARWQHPGSAQQAITSAAACSSGIAMVSNACVTVLAVDGDSLSEACRHSADADISGVALLPLPGDAEGHAQAMLLAVGSRSQPRGMLLGLVPSPGSSNSKAAALAASAQLLEIETTAVPVSFALAARPDTPAGALSSVVLCTGTLTGDVLLFSLSASDSAEPLAAILLQAVSVGSTHVTFAPLPATASEQQTSSTVASTSPPRAPTAILALSNVTALLHFVQPRLPAMCNGAEHHASLCCPPTLLVSPVATDAADSLPLAACALTEDKVVWSVLGGGVYSGTLQRAAKLCHRERQLSVLPRSLQHCSGCNAVAGHVRLILLLA
jgi:hypothetical protein